MTIQNYLIVENNVVTNTISWDGNTQTWTPPLGSIQLVQANTQALIWQLNADQTDYILIEVLGAGQIGFTWNTTTQVLTTNQSKPTKPIQPVAIGLQTA
jgi:hypothetical protein